MDGKTYSTDKEFRYEIKENFEITAIFDNNVDSSSEEVKKNELNNSEYCNVNVEIKGDGTITGAGKYHRGQKIELMATAAENAKFKGWIINQKTVSTDCLLEYEVTSDVLIVALFEEYVFPFEDVKKDKWYYDAVRYVYYNDIMNGTGEKSFEPGKNCTREMMVQILYNAEGKKDVDITNPFKDNVNGKWYYKSILWAVKNGITVGTSENTFGTGKNVTRQEMAGFLYNYAKMKGYSLAGTKELTEFEDADKISAWALKKMKWANANGIINGKEKDGHRILDPRGTATRAEVAQMIMNYVERFTDMYKRGQRK